MFLVLSQQADIPVVSMTARGGRWHQAKAGKGLAGLGWLTGPIFIPLAEAAVNDPLFFRLEPLCSREVAAVGGSHGRDGALQSTRGRGPRFMNDRGAAASHRRTVASSGASTRLPDRAVDVSGNRVSQLILGKKTMVCVGELWGARATMAFVIRIQPTELSLAGPKALASRAKVHAAHCNVGMIGWGLRLASVLLKRPKMNETGVRAVAMWLACPSDGISRPLRFVGSMPKPSIPRFINHGKM